MKKYLAYLSALLFGGVLFSLAWAPTNFFLGAMLGFVPLLLIEHWVSLNSTRFRRNKIYWAAWICFAVWNFCGIYWSGFASPLAVIASVLVNSSFFAGVFLLFSQVKKNLGNKVGYLSFVVFWMAWEYIEIVDWDLSWPWLTLGYALGDYPWMIQWYEYSGALGGSLWLVLINVAVFKFVLSFYEQKESFIRFKKGLNVLYLILLPMAFSLVMYYTYDEKGDEASIVVVQPNEDPYSGWLYDEKGLPRKGLNIKQKLEWSLSLAEKELNDSVDFLMFPESFMPRSFWANELQNYPEVELLRAHQLKFPATTYLFGIAYKEEFKLKKGEELPFDAHWEGYTKRFYKNHNSAMVLNTGGEDSLYHKSRLVIGPERIPPYFVFLQRYMDTFEDDSQGTSHNFNHTIQQNRDVFVSKSGKVKVAPIICYESIFGEFLNGYVKNGANLLAVITNDGWWGESPGYKQHFSYSRLRAIETRRAVARSANTGWSGFINQRGDVIQKSDYWVPAALKSNVRLNEELTFYVKHGDVIGRLALPISILLLINLVIRIIRKRAKVKVTI